MGFNSSTFGFNGKEMDNETSGTGNMYDYGFRIYNPRIGKFLSVDPLFKSYPSWSPYPFAMNNAISGIDLDGLEYFYAADGKYIGCIGSSTEIYIVSQKEFYTGPNDPESRSAFLISRGIRAYSSEKEASIAWAPEGHAATIGDNFERASAFYHSAASGGPVESLFVLGNTVKGKKEEGKDWVEPFTSEAPTLDGEKLSDIKKVSFKTIEYTSKDYSRLIPKIENVRKTIMVESAIWTISGFVHTHTKSDIEGLWSYTSDGMGGGYSGDIGEAMNGYNVYLLLTNKSKPAEMQFLRHEDVGYPMYFDYEPKARRYYKSNNSIKTIYLDGEEK